MNRLAGGFVFAVMDAVELPVPPGGVRPGHLGLIASGRVILGDIAATAVDLSLRGWLEIESSGDRDTGLGRAAAGHPGPGGVRAGAAGMAGPARLPSWPGPAGR